MRRCRQQPDSSLKRIHPGIPRRCFRAGRPEYRRRKFVISPSFFDMLISTLDGTYLTRLADYSRALAQRNRALKPPVNRSIVAAFEPELAANAPSIAALRRQYAGSVEQELNALLKQRGGGEFRILYRFDYPESESEYLALLERTGKGSCCVRVPASVPQLDEFEFYLDGRQLRHYGSTGQIRMISLLLKLAEFNLVRRSAIRKSGGSGR